MGNESKRKAPAFPLYVDDFISGTAIMSQEEVGAYVRLLCHQWNRGSIPQDTRLQERLAGGPVTDIVLEKFPAGIDGALRNMRLESVRQDREKFVEKQRLNALAGVAARAKAQPNGSQTGAKLQPDDQPNGSQKSATGSAKLNPPSPLPLPLPISKPSVGDKSPEEASGKQAEEAELELEVQEVQPKKRKQNELLNALLSECGIENPTKSQFSMGNKFLAEIKAVDPEVTVQQIRLFCSQKRSEWRGLDFTPAAVAKHWKAPCSPGNGHSSAEPTPDNPFPGTGPVTLSMIHARFTDNHERYRWMMEMDDQGRFQNG